MTDIDLEKLRRWLIGQFGVPKKISAEDPRITQIRALCDSYDDSSHPMLPVEAVREILRGDA